MHCLMQWPRMRGGLLPTPSRLQRLRYTVSGWWVASGLDFDLIPSKRAFEKASPSLHRTRAAFRFHRRITHHQHSSADVHGVSDGGKSNLVRPPPRLEKPGPPRAMSSSSFMHPTNIFVTWSEHRLPSNLTSSSRYLTDV